MGGAVQASARLGRETGGSRLGGIASAAKGALAQRAGNALGIGAAADKGRDGAWIAMTGNRSSPSSGGDAGDGTTPAWAQRLRAEQGARSRRQLAVQTLKDGDRGGASATPDIRERD